MDRRRFLKRSAVGTAGLAVVAAGGGTLWLRGDPAPIAGFESLPAAQDWLQQVLAAPDARSLTPWSVPQVLEHCAQSIEFSLHGFPQAKPAFFQASVGALAFATFNRAGAMRHATTDPIPGAPALAASSLANAAGRLGAALRAFAAHAGPLHPHFAYGALSRADFERAHLLHLADHAAEIVLA